MNPQTNENLHFAVELWTEDGQHVDEVLARSSRIVIARAALDSAIAEFPGRIITLCQGGRLIDGTARRQREAEKAETGITTLE
jgi:hypothetical protein